MRLGDDFFTGTIDRIIKNDRGHWQVIDYKTNRISANRVKAVAQKYHWQMKGYALLLSHLYPQQETFPVLLYFVHPGEIFEQSFNKQEIEKIKEEFLTIIEEIKEKYPVQ